MMWQPLMLLRQQLEAALNLAPMSKRTHEPGMEQFNQDQWVNRTWSFEGVRRAHIDVVDATADKQMWMMHVCLMPDIGSDAPIYGFDVISGRNKVTGAFLDLSPTTNADHPMIKHFAATVEGAQWSKQRELPDWAKAIFSSHMVAAGNVRQLDELEQITTMAKHLLWYYIDNAKYYRGTSEDYMTIASQNHYAKHQKMNPHTPKVMKSLGLPDSDVDVFVDCCLFPEIEVPADECTRKRLSG